MAVVTLSRQFGSGGDAIAAQVCDLLDYRYFDKQVMIEAAAYVGLSDEEVVDFSEDRYEIQSFITRLFRERSRTLKQVLIRHADHGPVEPLNAHQLDEGKCVDLVRYTVLSAYEAGNTVVVGRGGQAILRSRRNALHVRVVAPLEMRIQHLRDQGMSGRSEIKAKIARKDRATAEYLKRFFDIEWDDPTLYHLVINTGLLSIDAAAALIAEGVRQIEAKAVA